MDLYFFDKEKAVTYLYSDPDGIQMSSLMRLCLTTCCLTPKSVKSCSLPHQPCFLQLLNFELNEFKFVDGFTSTRSLVKLTALTRDAITYTADMVKRAIFELNKFKLVGGFTSTRSLVKQTARDTLLICRT